MRLIWERSVNIETSSVLDVSNSEKKVKGWDKYNFFIEYSNIWRFLENKNIYEKKVFLNKRDWNIKGMLTHF